MAWKERYMEAGMWRVTTVWLQGDGELSKQSKAWLPPGRLPAEFETGERLKKKWKPWGFPMSAKTRSW